MNCGLPPLPSLTAPAVPPLHIHPAAPFREINPHFNTVPLAQHQPYPPSGIGIFPFELQKITLDTGVR